MIGRTISHFKILEELGSGGMGTVFKAEDTNLHRPVALKFLPPEALLEDTDRARFLVEARSSASLSHESICTVYSIEEHDEGLFIAMEYLPGQSLKDLIAQGPLTVKRALRLAVQIGTGLQCAHEQGIIHRDIKPANIVATDRGQAKILDFGLARISGATQLTITGSIMGTVAYMSPEQTSGAELDHRTDIWSLGALTYELITGHPPFTGDYNPTIIYAILNLDPEPLQSLRSNLPPDLQPVLTKALAKDPDDRYQHADEFVVDLKRILRETSTQNTTTRLEVSRSAPGSARRNSKPLLWILPLVACFLLALGFFLGRNYFQSLPSMGPITQFTVPLPVDNTLGQDEGPQGLAISPDGSRIVYVVRDDEDSHLVIHFMDQIENTELEDTEGAFSPFFSPDGSWIGFFTRGKLKKISLNDRTVLTLCAAPHPRGGHWGTEGNIVLSLGDGFELFTVPDTGGPPQPIPGSRMSSELDKYRMPHILPDNAGLLATQWTGYDYESPSKIISFHPASGKKTVLVEGGRDPVYVNSGHILFIRGTSLMAIPFDPKSRESSGQPFMVESDCGLIFAVANNGTLVFPHGGGPPLVFQQERRLVWVDRTGTTTPVEIEAGPYVFPVLAPDGNRLGLTFFLENGLENRVWDLKRKTITRLTELSFDHIPVWSPDGKQIAFSCSEGQAPNVFIRSSDGRGTSERLTTSPYHQDPVSWSQDGRILTIVDFKTPFDGDINLIEFIPNGQEVKPFLNTRFDERHPMVSPDGAWMVFTSNQSGRREVFLTPLADSSRQTQISSGGGSDPLWSSDGKEIFFWVADEDNSGEYPTWNTLMVVQIDGASGKPLTTPQILFKKDWVYHSAGRPNYDVSRDNKRFLMLEADTYPPTHLRVILNWFNKFQGLRG